jgi:hypothetical protein
VVVGVAERSNTIVVVDIDCKEMHPYIGGLKEEYSARIAIVVGLVVTEYVVLRV